MDQAKEPVLLAPRLRTRRDAAVARPTAAHSGARIAGFVAEKKRKRPKKEPKLLDLEQFISMDDAMEKAEPGNRYVELGRILMPQSQSDGLPLNLVTLFWMSMLTRSQGLHSAIAREIRHENAHAVFPLLRAFAEATVVVIYVIDHPHYINALTQRPSEPDAPKRKSMQALISYAAKEATGMKAVYADLSEATHFGAVAMWASMKPEQDEARSFSWSSYPRWRDDQGLIACAQVLELADAMEMQLRRFAVEHLGVEPEIAFPS